MLVDMMGCGPLLQLSVVQHHLSDILFVFVFRPSNTGTRKYARIADFLRGHLRVLDFFRGGDLELVPKHISIFLLPLSVFLPQLVPLPVVCISPAKHWYLLGLLPSNKTHSLLA